MVKIKIEVLIPFFIPLFLGGCWDAEEITNRTIVLASGIDLTANGSVKISAQVPIVEELLPIGGNPQGDKHFSLLTAVGASPFAAIAGLQSKTQRSVFYGQIKAILIGKELAEKGLKKGIYPLNRYAKVPPQAFLLLTKDKAYEVLDLSLWDNRIPASALVDFFHAQEKGDQAFSQQIWEFSRNINSRTQDGFLPLLAYDQEDKAFIINGLGVFHQDRLVGELSGEEARMFGLVSGRSQNAHLHLSVPGFGSLTYRKIRARPRISLRKNAMKPVFTIDLKVQGYLAESTEGEIKLTKEDTRIIDREVSKYLHREMVKTLQNIQALNSDL